MKEPSRVALVFPTFRTRSQTEMLFPVNRQVDGDCGCILGEIWQYGGRIVAGSADQVIMVKAVEEEEQREYERKANKNDWQ